MVDLYYNLGTGMMHAVERRRSCVKDPFGMGGDASWENGVD